MHFVKLNLEGEESAYLHFAVQFFHDTPQASKQASKAGRHPQPPPPSPQRWQLDARCKIIPFVPLPRFLCQWHEPICIPKCRLLHRPCLGEWMAACLEYLRLPSWSSSERYTSHSHLLWFQPPPKSEQRRCHSGMWHTSSYNVLKNVIIAISSVKWRMGPTAAELHCSPPDRSP